MHGAYLSNRELPEHFKPLGELAGQKRHHAYIAFLIPPSDLLLIFRHIPQISSTSRARFL